MSKIDFGITDEAAEAESSAMKKAFKIKRPKRRRGRTRGHNTQQKEELLWSDRLKDRPLESFVRPVPPLSDYLRETLGLTRSNP